MVFVYLDPQAGFTWLRGGEARLDEHGDLQWTKRQPSHFTSLVRMQGNPFGVVLDDRTMGRLGLQNDPDGRASRSQGSDLVKQRIGRARALNHMGESQAALEILEEAYVRDPQATGVAFELAFALNARGRHARAETVAGGGLERDGRNPLLCNELGYAQLQLRRFDEAAKTYNACLALLPSVTDREAAEIKAQMAYNLSQAYKGMGDPDSCRKWLQAAADWAPDLERRHQINLLLKDDASCVSR